MSEYPSHVAIAKITDPADVQAKCTSYNIEYHKGAIFVHIPELGYEGVNYVYCRYALSLPYIRIQKGWKVLVHPSIIEDSGERKRWFFIGIVDCGGGQEFTPDTDMQLMIQLLSQVIYAKTDGTMHLSALAASEPFVLGNKLTTWITNTLKALIDDHTHLYTPGTGTPTQTAATTTKLTAPTDIKSVKVFGE